jgi:hypothetical protein
MSLVNKIHPFDQASAQCKTGSFFLMAQTATTLEPYILKYSLLCPESMEM